MTLYEAEVKYSLGEMTFGEFWKFKKFYDGFNEAGLFFLGML